MKKRILIALAICLLLPLATGPAFSDQEADAGKKIIKKWQDVVVTVKIVNQTLNASAQPAAFEGARLAKEVFKELGV